MAPDGPATEWRIAHDRDPGRGRDRNRRIIPSCTAFVGAGRSAEEDICLLVPFDPRMRTILWIEIPGSRMACTSSPPPVSSLHCTSSIRQSVTIEARLRVSGMFAYAGPSAFLLLLAAVCGSMCFRYGRRGPAFAGLTFAMVLYVGLLDAVVLHRRAGVMADPTKPETVRITAMSAMTGTFFHAKRAGTLIETLLRDPKTPDSLRGIATRRSNKPIVQGFTPLSHPRLLPWEPGPAPGRGSISFPPSDRSDRPPGCPPGCHGHRPPCR